MTYLLSVTVLQRRTLLVRERHHLYVSDLSSQATFNMSKAHSGWA